QAYLPELIALAFTGITTFLLVEDLTRPMKFLTLLTRPNTKSWLVKGAWILIGFSTLTSAILALRWFGMDELADTLRYVNLPFAALAAAYTAFLFKQCEGRDLWQGPLLLPQLLGQAVFLGAAAFVPFVEPMSTLAWIGWAGFFVHFVVALLEWKLPHASANARQAAGFLGRVKLGTLPAFALGLVAVAAAQLGAHFVPPVAFVLAFAGLMLHEHAFVRAGQLPPLS
ncbi:MAG: polysulfide reductase NrfD, partial [Planctomycetes bacterium]|nr:polysulfide reductase NrfD [Planctomycetota bacterium]